MEYFKKSLVFLFVVFSAFFCFSSVDCDQAKRDILVQCDSIESDLITITNNLTIAKRFFDGTYIEKESGTDTYYSPFVGQNLYDSQGNSLGLRVSELFYYVNDSLGMARYNLSSVQVIRDSVNSIQCSGSNTCNCAEYLAPIMYDVERIRAEVVSMQALVDEITMNIIDINENIGSILENFDNVFEYFNYVTNQLSHANSWTSPFSLPSVWIMKTGGSQNAVSSSSWKPFHQVTDIQNSTWRELVGYGLRTIFATTASLNNFAHSNTFTHASIWKSSVSNNVALGTVSRILDRGFDSVTNQFSIFIGASAGASPVLGSYTESDGSYHTYLTNYYINVSGSSISGSTPLTNWFNRIEMLLAALVFQDDDGPNTNSIPSSSSFDSLKSELNQNMTSINQQGQDYLSTVDTSGKSLLSMLGEWNSAVSGVAKPSAFVIASIPTQASSPSTRSSSSDSGSSLDITLDTDNDSLSGFIELVRGVTTLAWVTLFLVVGYFLSIRIIALIGKLISFGYSVYAAVFGGG